MITVTNEFSRLLRTISYGLKSARDTYFIYVNFVYLYYFQINLSIFQCYMEVVENYIFGK